jgi:hypothetical protein
MVYGNGDFYKGQWSYGLRHGIGFFQRKDGVSFLGTWINDHLGGKVTLTYLPEGDRYVGTWKENDFEGEVEVHYGDGTYYKGEIVNGWRDGDGFTVTSNKTLLKGRYVDDMLHGFGTKSTISGQVYTGEFCNGVSCGNGELWMPNGDFYKGEFENDKRHGKGMYYFAHSGDTLEGEWFNNQIHGQGVIKFAYGGEFRGLFERGSVKTGTLHTLLGETIYAPKWTMDLGNKDIIPVGQVIKTLASGSVIEGIQENGKWTGNVYYTCPHHGIEKQLMKANGFLVNL